MTENNDNIIEVKNLVKYFPLRGGLLGQPTSWVHAVDDVSFNIKRGQTLGLVGESGCGKTTVGRLVLKLIEPTSGEVIFNSKNIYDEKFWKEKEFRRNAQIIFQDAFSSFDIRKNVESIVGEPLLVHGIAQGKELKEKVDDLLKLVGLKPEIAKEYPHTLSSGQKQCVGIARSLALNPTFVVADEPISALDVSVRAQILNLLKDLQKKLNLTYLFISHDIRVVYYLSDYIAVMYVGKLVETGPAEEVFAHRLHPYTEALLTAVPIEDPKIRAPKEILQGEVPSPVDPPPGCRFYPRCKYAIAKCKDENPELIEKSPGHFVSCFVDFHGSKTII
ncbi:ABC transporter ATP-binding protein [Tepidanaerobacter syntrophicus]|uniref:ABC transporter ATP-binding protein n=1 Tax=Tepidanaerobacter syntrophicus TaxID=224999 RepID=UPI0022ED5034|nr:ABC transporter ATP-binding protein [Tepidanaerobacter syntrophicus]GLI20299.1 ABC transporter ATP-binding protein [Tepidanaerobacter syntrophicus]